MILPLILVLFSIVVGFCCKSKALIYQCAVFCAYIVLLTYSGELDYLLPVYAVVTLVPILRKASRYTVFAALFCLVLLFYTGFGVLFQDMTAAVVFAFARMAQFALFLLALACSCEELDAKSGCRLVLFLVLVETAVDFYLLGNSTYGSGEAAIGRLVVNSQPIGGNIGLVCYPIIAMLLLKYDLSNRQTMFLLICSLIFCIWAVMSGTRGYTIVLLPGYAILFFAYVTSGRLGRKGTEAVILLVLSALIVVMLFIPSQEDPLSTVRKMLYMDKSLGSRDYENAIAIDFFIHSDFFTKVFGIGYGGTWNDYPAFSNAVFNVVGIGGLRSRLFISAGSLYHNLYANVLGLQGAAGLCLVLSVFAVGINAVIRLNGVDKRLKACLVFYIIAYGVSLFFRWPADCGVTEMVVTAFVISSLRSHNQDVVE